VWLNLVRRTINQHPKEFKGMLKYCLPAMALKAFSCSHLTKNSEYLGSELLSSENDKGKIFE
jgi:hypothetical protein